MLKRLLGIESKASTTSTELSLELSKQESKEALLPRESAISVLSSIESKESATSTERLLKLSRQESKEPLLPIECAIDVLSPAEIVLFRNRNFALNLLPYLDLQSLGNFTFTNKTTLATTKSGLILPQPMKAQLLKEMRNNVEARKTREQLHLLDHAIDILQEETRDTLWTKTKRCLTWLTPFTAIATGLIYKTAASYTSDTNFFNTMDDFGYQLTKNPGGCIDFRYPTNYSSTALGGLPACWTNSTGWLTCMPFVLNTTTALCNFCMPLCEKANQFYEDNHNGVGHSGVHGIYPIALAIFLVVSATIAAAIRKNPLRNLYNPIYKPLNTLSQTAQDCVREADAKTQQIKPNDKAIKVLSQLNRIRSNAYNHSSYSSEAITAFNLFHSKLEERLAIAQSEDPLPTPRPSLNRG